MGMRKLENNYEYSTILTAFLNLICRCQCRDDNFLPFKSFSILADAIFFMD